MKLKIPKKMKMMKESCLFEEKLERDREWFSSEFKKILKKYLTNISPNYREKIYYPLFPAGKYIRPILMFSSADMLNVKREDILYPAFCIELIHNYSLIHDDLPCMDNDDFRRGRLTLHKKYSESDAILIGDGLLTLSFEILSDWKKKDVIIEVLKLISHYVGFSGLIKGQFMDLDGKRLLKENKNQRSLFKYLETLSINKTAKLIEVALVVPGMVAKLKRSKLEILKIIGRKIGLLFQITDDLIDFKSGQDKENLNYPLLVGVEKTCKFIEEYKKDIISKIDKEFPLNNEYLKFLVEKISSREK